MNELKIGIVGVGNIGTAHAWCIYNGEIKGLKLNALCDISPDRKVFCSENFLGVPFFDSFEQMLLNADIDAVIISVPHKFHSDYSLSALKSGLNVLCEKPIDISVKNTLMLSEYAKKSDKVFAIMFNQRTSPLFIKAREIIISGQLGEIKRSVWIVTNWYRTQAYYDSGDWRATWKGEGGGVLINQAPHNLDLWQWICGMPKSVTAFCDEAKFHNVEVEDSATIYTEYENGAIGTFITSTGEYPGTNRLEISGEKGKIVIENRKLKWWKLSENERDICFNSKESLIKVKPDYEEFEQNEHESGHKGILQNFANAILNGEELISPGLDGINELILSNAAYMSSWLNNKKIDIPFDFDEYDNMLFKKMKHSSQKIHAKSFNDEKGYQKRWKVNW